jgi:hypothetical protein
MDLSWSPSKPRAEEQQIRVDNSNDINKPIPVDGSNNNKSLLVDNNDNIDPSAVIQISNNYNVQQQQQQQKQELVQSKQTIKMDPMVFRIPQFSGKGKKASGGKGGEGVVRDNGDEHQPPQQLVKGGNDEGLVVRGYFTIYIYIYICMYIQYREEVDMYFFMNVCFKLPVMLLCSQKSFHPHTSLHKHHILLVHQCVSFFLFFFFFFVCVCICI